MKKSAGKSKAPAGKPKGVNVNVAQVVEIAKRATGPKPGARGRFHRAEFGTGVPNECHRAWYYAWAVQHRGFQEIANEVGVSRVAVCKAVRRVAEWMRLELFDEVLEFRHRQTATLENMVAEALRAWHKSKEIAVTVTTETDYPAGGSGMTRVKTQEKHQTGDASYLAVAIAAMADIRKIWGVDKPIKVEVSGRNQGEGLERICGLTPAEAIRNQARAMLERADRMEVIPA